MLQARFVMISCEQIINLHQTLFCIPGRYCSIYRAPDFDFRLYTFQNQKESALSFSLSFVMSLSLEERKRKLAEARAAREAKDKQVVELGEQLAKMQTGPSAVPILDAPQPIPSAAKVPPRAPDSGVQISRVHQLAIVDIPPLPPQRAETYSKTVNTDPVFVYSEERTVSDAQQGSTAHHEEAPVRLGLAPAKMGGSVWDGSSLSSKLLRTQHFLNFVDTASTVMGSALGTNSVSPAVVFSTGLRGKVSGVLARRGSFISESVRRDQLVVVAMAFQPASSESFAVAYGTGEHPGSTLDGRLHDSVAFWNTRRGLPVMFQFRYEIHALCFSRFHPHVLFGGSAKGHIVMWDTRNSTSPSAVTFPSLNSHNMPITHMRVVGDATKSSLVTVSLDGRVCLWSIGDLRHPAASMVVCSAQSDTSRMNITAASVPLVLEGRDVETSKVYFGGTKGSLHVATRNIVDRRIIASQVSSFSHEGTVNAVDTHPAHSDSSISNLIVTASSDWSCRVWLGDASIKIGLKDIVLDVQWSPTRPSVFAACDASGTVTVWDILHSVQAPVGSLVLEDSTAPGGKGHVMLHRLSWDDSGENLIVGGNQGETYYIAVNLPSREGDDTPTFSQWIARNMTGSE